ncbi:MAG: Peptidase family, partial [Mucilaginibacter sp.]|nr:Peptidase family [Mucilaginibacter sp.]
DTKKEYGTRRFCFIVNRFVNINTLRAILALRNRNLCNVIIDGPVPEYVYGDFYRMTLADNINIKIKTTELIYEDGTTGPDPDLILPASADTSLQSAVIKAARGLLQKAILPASAKHPENTVYIRKPQSDYPTNGVPDAKLRLLGLFNFWNAIQYFSPNKDLIAYNWDKALIQFIPEFLDAKTDSAYFMALMHLTACINDGHSILISKRGGRSPNGVLDGNLPVGADLVDGKVFITAVLDDKTQQAELSKLTEGDELIAINGVPVAKLAEQWRPYIVASNTAGFNREYYYTWLTNGIVGSQATLTVSSSGKIKQVILNRIKRDDYYSLRGKILRNPLLPPYCKIIKGNIGYMRVNRIYTNELDSLANMLKNCKSIILDCRGYPKDYKIGSALAAYIAVKTDTVAINKFPYVTSPNQSKNQVIIDYEIINPNNNQNLKHKKYYLLADEGNQSQSEGNVITLQGVTHGITIGSTTAGANGMAITINLPGQYFSFFSGFGEYYPDNTPNQKLGVKIDVPVAKTLNGILKGDDEILDKALALID